MRASSAATTRSQCRARSVPPARQFPCTWAMTGSAQSQMRAHPSPSASMADTSPSIAVALREVPRVGVLGDEPVARGERASGAADDDARSPRRRPRLPATARSISRTQRGVSGLWWSGRFRVRRRTRPISSTVKRGEARCHGPLSVGSATRARDLRHLAALVARERVDHGNAAGHLVVGQTGQEERAQFVGRHGPSRRTTQAATSSPRTGWGTPATAASVTAGCSKSAASTSPGTTLWPPRMMISFSRPVDPQVAVGVERSPGPRSAATRRPRCCVGGRRRLRGTPAAGPRPADGHLADLARPQRRAVRARRSGPRRPGSGTPDRTQVAPAVAERRGGHRTELGHAVAAQHLGRRQAGAEPPQRGLGDRRAADVDHGQAGEVGRLEAGARRRSAPPWPAPGTPPPGAPRSTAASQRSGVEAREEPPAQPAAQRARRRGAIRWWW